MSALRHAGSFLFLQGYKPGSIVSALCPDQIHFFLPTCNCSDILGEHMIVQENQVAKTSTRSLSPESCPFLNFQGPNLEIHKSSLECAKVFKQVAGPAAAKIIWHGLLITHRHTHFVEVWDITFGSRILSSPQRELAITLCATLIPHFVAPFSRTSPTRIIIVDKVTKT